MTPKTVLIALTMLASFLLVGCGEDSSSAIAPTELETVDTVPPATPTGVHVYAFDTNVELVWSENAEPDLAGYILERSIDKGVTWAAVGTDLLTSAAFTDVRLESASYRVSATDLSENQSAFSSNVGYTTRHPKPGFPEKPVEPGN